jgi:membrane protease YdiL (CAAX protease family)
MKRSLSLSGSTVQSGKSPASFLKRNALPIGIVLMFVLTWTIDLALAAESRGLLGFNIPLVVALSLGYGFVVATLLMTGLLQGKSGIVALLKRYLIWRVGIAWYLAALLLPTLIYLTAIGVYTIFGGQAPDFSQTMAHQIFGTATSLWLVIPFLLFDMLTNGEEIGWRGYVLPRLQWRYSALISSLILGVIWTMWHIPKFLVAGNNTPFVWYLIMTIARAILFTWVYNNTRGSLLLVTIFHAAINTTYVFLPVAPPVVGGSGLFELAVIIECLAAIVVVLVAGAQNLSRAYPAQVEGDENEATITSLREGASSVN